MAFKSYGGLNWDDQKAEPHNSFVKQAVILSAAAGVTAATGWAATRTFADGTKPVDYMAAGARTAGNFSPFQLFNTFRAPEALSPFTSLKYKVGDETVAGVSQWDKGFLQSESTYEWLKYTTGRTTDELKAAGITPGMKGDAAADAVEWMPHGSSGRGSLFSVRNATFENGVLTGGTRTPLSHDVHLMAMNHEVVNPFTNQKGVNRVAAGMMDAADMGSRTLSGGKSFDPTRVALKETYDAATKSTTRQQAPFIFAPSVRGSVGSWADLGRRTNYVRGLAAFEMDRFNRLISGVGEQFLGKTGGEAFKKILGVQPGVRSGPASAMLARFGGRAAAAGGLYMGLQQIDWARRNFSTPGEIFASGAVSTGLAYGLGKLNVSPKAAAMAGVASFFGQMVMPGFDQGVIQGVATTAVNLDIMRGNALNPFNYLRRTLEGFAPGVTDWETGGLFAISAMAATSLQLPAAKGTVAQALLERIGPRTLGLKLDPNAVGGVAAANQGLRNRFWQNLSGETDGPAMPSKTLGNRKNILSSLWSKHRRNKDTLGFFKKLNSTWYAAEKELEQSIKNNPMNDALRRRMQDIANKYSGNNIVDSVRRNVSGFGAQAYYSFFGANLGVDESLRSHIQDLGFGTIKSSKGGFRLPTPTGRWGKLGTVGAAAFLMHGVLTGGLLGSKETSQELSDIYSGKELVAVKSSRWWEAGGTPFEGGDTKYYRPHQYHLMMNRVRGRGIWGGGEDDISPLGKFVRKNFTYDLELRNYWDRPYPISSAAFSDVPIIGGVLAGTIGQLIKPPRVMHSNEWMREGEGGGLEYASVFKGSRREPAMGLGAHHGVPQSPFGVGAQLGFLSYQFRELEGMTGWAKNVIQAGLTGSANFGTDAPMLAEAGLMTSPRLRFWETQMGGALFANEFVRRILPSYRSEVERVNPLANSMPGWLPDKFQWGDPYRLVEWGEGRLPGEGYAALHPELQGVDPEAYPLLHRYAILSDVSPMSPEYNITKQQIYKRRSEGAYTKSEIDYMEAIDERHRRQVSGFQDDRLHPNAISLPGSGMTRAAWGFGQRQLRNVAAPGEYLVPMGFRPVQKLMGKRDMVEQYEYERMYGTQMAFWDKPWRDWLRPSMYTTLHNLGWDGKPVWRQEADSTNEYFDKLEFVKWMNLMQQAQASGDNAAAQRYRYAASNTRHGVNPQGSPLSIYWTLPDSERKFFNSFAQASGSDRKRVLEMVPEDQRHLYQAIWSRMDNGQSVWAGADSKIDDAYMVSQYDEAAARIGQAPSPDWIGWHEDVDMDDIRVRYVDNIGAELADYGLWESQLKKSMQQPFLEGSAEYMTPGNVLNRTLPGMTGVPMNRGSWQIAPTAGTMSSVQIRYDDNRSGDIATAVERYISGY